MYYVKSKTSESHVTRVWGRNASLPFTGVFPIAEDDRCCHLWRLEKPGGASVPVLTWSARVRAQSTQSWNQVLGQKIMNTRVALWNLRAQVMSLSRSWGDGTAKRPAGLWPDANVKRYGVQVPRTRTVSIATWNSDLSFHALLFRTRINCVKMLL